MIWKWIFWFFGIYFFIEACYALLLDKWWFDGWWNWPWWLNGFFCVLYFILWMGERDD
jgi:hypothetical protein